jgi:hypothetical protein
MKPVLLDTGFIVALLNRSESLHKTYARTIREVQAPLVTCEAVITVCCYLLRNLSGASEAVIENIAAGIFQVPFQLSRETAAVKQLLRKLPDSLGGPVRDRGHSDAGSGFRNLSLGQEQTLSRAAEHGFAPAKRKRP